MIMEPPAKHPRRIPCTIGKEPCDMPTYLYHCFVLMVNLSKESATILAILAHSQTINTYHGSHLGRRIIPSKKIILSLKKRTVCAKTACWLKLEDVVEHMSSPHTYLRRVNAFHRVNFHSTRHDSGNRFALTATHRERSEARGHRMSRPASSSCEQKIDVNVQSV